MVAERSEKTIDVEEFIKANYPDAKYEPNYKPQDTDDVFLAFRIAPNKLKYISAMKKKIEGVFKTTVCDADGWVPFAIFGQKITRSEYEAMGFSTFVKWFAACLINVLSSVKGTFLNTRLPYKYAISKW